MCNDGFVKALLKIGDCQSVGAFTGWLRKIFVHAAIDHYRKYRQSQPVLGPIEAATGQVFTDSSAIDRMSVDEKLRLLKSLPPVYQMTFNLYVLEGFSTTEIAEKLQVAEGTVRGNLAKARLRLQSMIESTNKISTRYE